MLKTILDERRDGILTKEGTQELKHHIKELQKRERKE